MCNKSYFRNRVMRVIMYVYVTLNSNYQAAKAEAESG